MTRSNQGDKPMRLAATSEIKLFFVSGSFERVDLMLTDEGYQACLHTDKEIYVVAKRGRDKARHFRKLETGIEYLQEHFGPLHTINVIFPPPPQSE
jgi:hypothetical protein